MIHILKQVLRNNTEQYKIKSLNESYGQGQRNQEERLLWVGQTHYRDSELYLERFLKAQAEKKLNETHWDFFIRISQEKNVLLTPGCQGCGEISVSIYGQWKYNLV